jgi:DNA-binding LytR/AlgR family response regulator
VVDDDPVARAVVERYVERHDELRLAASVGDADAATEVLRRDDDLDLVVLDIEMPGMSGLELADLEVMHGLATRPQVVFVTAKEDYAVEAFAVEATDYLVKPVRYARFQRAIERVLRLRAADASLATPDEAQAASTGGGEVTGAGGDEPVFVKVDGRLVRLDLDELKWVEAQGDYMLLTTTDSRYLIHSTMKTLAEKLPDAFVRVHRSFIVRIDRIEDIEDTTLVIDRKVIPIGASYRDRLMERLNTL